MNAVMTSVGYPKRLELRNKISGTNFDLRLKEAAELQKDILIEDVIGSHVLIDQPFSCAVCEAAAVFSLTVEILEPRVKSYLKKCKDLRVSLRVDGVDVLKNEIVKSGVPIPGKNFIEQEVLYEAAMPKGDRVGLFMPNGCILSARISGLARTKILVKVRVTLDMALYTTRA